LLGYCQTGWLPFCGVRRHCVACAKRSMAPLAPRGRSVCVNPGQATKCRNSFPVRGGPCRGTRGQTGLNPEIREIRKRSQVRRGTTETQYRPAKYVGLALRRMATGARLYVSHRSIRRRRRPNSSPRIRSPLMSSLTFNQIASSLGSMQRSQGSLQTTMERLALEYRTANQLGQG
jgi:hypothetical protein